jgi:predicted nucleotide-binding protein
VDVHPELRAKYEALQQYDEETLRALFSTHGLLTIFEARGRQWSMRKRLYHALLVARRHDLLDDLPASIPHRLHATEPQAPTEIPEPASGSAAREHEAEAHEGVTSAVRGRSSNRLRKEWDRREVFLIHGRDLQVAEALKKFMRKLDLRPVTWKDRVGRSATSPYSGRMLHEAFRDIPVVIALLTPDDVVRLHEAFAHQLHDPDEAELSLQPRPNVLLEVGMALGSDEHTTVLVKVGPLRRMSGLAGQFILDLNGTDVALKELADTLKAIGCEVDENHSSNPYDPEPFQTLAARSRTVVERHTAVPESTNASKEAPYAPPVPSHLPPTDT